VPSFFEPPRTTVIQPVTAPSLFVRAMAPRPLLTVPTQPLSRKYVEELQAGYAHQPPAARGVAPAPIWQQVAPARSVTPGAEYFKTTPLVSKPLKPFTGASAGSGGGSSVAHPPSTGVSAADQKKAIEVAEAQAGKSKGFVEVLTALGLIVGLYSFVKGRG